MEESNTKETDESQSSRQFVGAYKTYVDSLRDLWTDAQKKCAHDYLAWVQDVQQVNQQLVSQCQNAYNAYIKDLQSASASNDPGDAVKDAARKYAEAIAEAQNSAKARFLEIQEGARKRAVESKEDFEKRSEVSTRTYVKDFQKACAAITTDGVDGDDLNQIACGLMATTPALVQTLRT